MESEAGSNTGFSGGLYVLQAKPWNTLVVSAWWDLWSDTEEKGTWEEKNPM